MDKYEILELIGEGSFGRVFRGKCKLQNNKLVALKLIPKVGKSSRDISSLRHECKLQRELDHPNIVRMLDAFETENEIVAVTEYVATGDLHKLFQNFKLRDFRCCLPESRVQQIAVDLVSALHYLHSHRILHRDVKPQNVLIDVNGSAKLCDFGFARNLSIDTFVLTSIKGTPLYMAPELIEEKPYDHSADLWSVGCILYELAVGTPPFATHSLFDLIKKIRHDQIHFPTHLSAECSSFLRGLLEKDCKRRLSWPDLLFHPFIGNDVTKRINLSMKIQSMTSGLTTVLTESQKLAKEIQRQDKAKLLPGGSQTLIKVAERYEQQKKLLMEAAKRKGNSSSLVPHVTQTRRYSDVGQGDDHFNFGGGRRHSDLTAYYYQYHLGTHQPYNVPTVKKNATSDSIHDRKFVSGYQDQRFRDCKISDEMQSHPSSAPLSNQLFDKKSNLQSPSALPTPQYLKEVRAPPVDKLITTDEELLASNLQLRSESDNTIENDEWCFFLDSQLEECIANDLQILSNLNDVVLLLAPLRRYSNTSALVMEKIGSLLILPLVRTDNKDRVEKVLDIYVSVKVVPNLMIGCKKLFDRCTIDEGMRAMEILLLLVARLSYTRQEFFHQVCESLTALKCSKTFEKILQSPDTSTELKVVCVSILNRVLSAPDLTPIDSLSVMAEIFVTESDQETVFSRLLAVANSELKEKVFLLIGLWARLDRKFATSLSKYFRNISQFDKTETKVSNAFAFADKMIF